jgi:hypothetical protein
MAQFSNPSGGSIEDSFERSCMARLTAAAPLT